MVDDLKRKLYCSVWDKTAYIEHCLFELGKVAEKNKTCQECVYHENLQLRKEIEEGILKKKQGLRIKEKRERTKTMPEDPARFYTIRLLSEYLGKPVRKIQKLVQAGRIPSAEKVGVGIGSYWRFPREVIDQWLLGEPPPKEEVKDNGCIDQLSDKQSKGLIEKQEN